MGPRGLEIINLCGYQVIKLSAYADHYDDVHEFLKAVGEIQQIINEFTRSGRGGGRYGGRNALNLNAKVRV